MRVELKELLSKLGVRNPLSPYETHPWFHYDAEKGISCSAEVRMGPGGDDIEAEIQFLKDKVEDSEEEGEGETETASGGIEQIMLMRAEPVKEDTWSPKKLIVKGEDYVNKIPNWEEKGCNFFLACVQAVQMNELPDVDMIIEKELPDENMGGGSRGRVGRKSPKVKPAQLLGMKKPGGGM